MSRCHDTITVQPMSFLLTLERMRAHHIGDEYRLTCALPADGVGDVGNPTRFEVVQSTFRAYSNHAQGRWRLGEQTSGTPACAVVLSALRAWLNSHPGPGPENALRGLPCWLCRLCDAQPIESCPRVTIR